MLHQNEEDDACLVLLTIILQNKQYNMHIMKLLFTFFIFISLRLTAQTGVPDFEVDVQVGCLPLEINITNKSTAANIFYIYGDGSSGVDLQHTYNQSGTYDLIQVVSGMNGTSLFDTIQIQVFEAESIFFETVLCQNNEVILAFSPQAYYTAYIINYGDGIIDTLTGTNFIRHSYTNENLNYNLTISAGFIENGELNISNCPTLSSNLRVLTHIILPEINTIEVLENASIEVSYTVSSMHRSVLSVNQETIPLDSSESILVLPCQNSYNQSNTFEIQTFLTSIFTNFDGGNIFCSNADTLKSTIFNLTRLPPPNAILYVDVDENNLLINWENPKFYPIKTVLLFRNDTLIQDNIDPNTVQFIDQSLDPQNNIYNYQLAYLNTCNEDTLFSNQASNIHLTGSFSIENNQINLSWVILRDFPISITYHLNLISDNFFQTLGSFSSIQTEFATFTHDNLDPQQNQFNYQVEAFISGIDLPIYSNNITFFRTLEIKIPDAFTPNGDGVNDVFRILGSNIKTVTLQVFNQWGNQVFESNSKDEGWNGLIQGVSAASGLYYYAVSIESYDKQNIEQKGSFLLIR